jgi:hypothetical protein
MYPGDENGEWRRFQNQELKLSQAEKFSPRYPRFASSNPAEVDGFFQYVKILNTIPPGGTLSWGPESEISGSLKNLRPEKISL